MFLKVPMVYLAMVFEFSLNVFTEFSKFNDKKYVVFRPGCFHSASKTQVIDRIFKLTSIHASVIYQIP